MPKILPKAYEPGEIEKHWRAFWKENRTFTPRADSDRPGYSIVIPPPNVTGALHIGHALNLTLIDLLCRHARQKGFEVLWVPGTDHAGISTQNVVEKALAAEGKGRHDLGREAFVQRVWQWRDEYGHRILGQIEALGCSVDWTRLRFTMDEGLSRAVRKVFVQLYNEGLIYRGDYIINWCRRCHTALADDEVERENEPGSLWHVAYPLADGSGEIVIATTRPETIPGDTAICVHPEDGRHARLIGKKALVPVLSREIPIIADSYVERDFGTGALKVTPCHDSNDWLLGQKHGLEFIQVIDENGVMTEASGPYAGLSMAECRARILEDLEAGGRIRKKESLEHAVGHCYRCHTVVEPHVSRQWFVAATKLAPEARAAVPSLTKLYPETWLKTYYHWLDNIRDWCISRQIWWGHRIPAWTCADCGELTVAEEDPLACPRCGSENLEQEDDVLDTWFSSALWPFSTLGWPDVTPELRKWYPTTVLVTGFDILFFWVARMMMMGQHFLGQPPFGAIYLHALVRDAEGRKMSKSLGNGIDPLAMIDKYGCDALRFTLTSLSAMGRDIRLSEDRIEGYRHFVNKLWNAARFALMNLPDHAPAPFGLQTAKAPHQIWILDRLEAFKLDMDQALADYRFNDAAQCAYRFLWNEFCDWYLELSKTGMQSDEPGAREREQFVLWTALRETLLLLHPIMPFVTASIWEALPGVEDDIAGQPYPPARPECCRPEESAGMETIMAVIVAARTIKAELGISPARRTDLILHPLDENQERLLRQGSAYIASLARLESLSFSGIAPKASATAVADGCQVFLPLAGAVNLVDELARLEKEMTRIEKELVDVRKKLHNESFVSRAPAEVVERERERAEKLVDARAKLEARKKLFAEAMAE